MEDRYIRLVDTNVCGSKYCMMQEIKVSSKELAGDIMEKINDAMKNGKANGGDPDQIFNAAIQVLKANGYTVDLLYPITVKV